MSVAADRGFLAYHIIGQCHLLVIQSLTVNNFTLTLLPRFQCHASVDDIPHDRIEWRKKSE